MWFFFLLRVNRNTSVVETRLPSLLIFSRNKLCMKETAFSFNCVCYCCILLFCMFCPDKCCYDLWWKNSDSLFSTHSTIDLWGPDPDPRADTLCSPEYLLLWIVTVLQVIVRSGVTEVRNERLQFHRGTAHLAWSPLTTTGLFIDYSQWAEIFISILLMLILFKMLVHRSGTLKSPHWPQQGYL